jgi:hypothetical protein
MKSLGRLTLDALVFSLCFFSALSSAEAASPKILSKFFVFFGSVSELVRRRDMVHNELTERAQVRIVHKITVFTCDGQRAVPATKLPTSTRWNKLPKESIEKHEKKYDAELQTIKTDIKDMNTNMNAKFDIARCFVCLLVCWFVCF